MDTVTRQERASACAMKIPLTAAEQLLAAQEAGHELTVKQTGPWPELGDPHAKYWVVCSCGYRSAVRRTRAATNSAMALHLGKALAEAAS